MSIGIDEQIADEQDMLDRIPETAAYSPMARAKLATLHQMKSIQDAAGGLPDIQWLHKFVNCVPFGEHCPPKDITKAHEIIDTLRTLLAAERVKNAELEKLQTSNEGRIKNIVDEALFERAEKAEAELAAEGKLREETADKLVAVLRRLEKADAINKRLVEGMIGPTEEMIVKMGLAGMDAWNNTLGTPLTRYAAIFKAMSAVLLKEVKE